MYMMHYDHPDLSKAFKMSDEMRVDISGTQIKQLRQLKIQSIFMGYINSVNPIYLSVTTKILVRGWIYRTLQPEILEILKDSKVYKYWLDDNVKTLIITLEQHEKIIGLYPNYGANEFAAFIKGLEPPCDYAVTIPNEFFEIIPHEIKSILYDQSTNSHIPGSILPH